MIAWTQAERIHPKSFLLKGAEHTTWRLGFSISVDQQQCPDQDGGEGEILTAGLQQIPSQEQTKDVGRCRGQAFVLNVSWHRGTHKMPVYRAEPCTGTHSLAQ